MALKDILNLVDDKLRDVFHTIAYSPEGDRAKMVKRIDTTREKFLATEPQRGTKDFKVANKVVEYRPTLNGGAVAIGGRDVSYIPSERFTDFLDGLKSAVEAGDLDKELEAAGKGEGTSAAPRAARQPRKPREPGSGGGSREWSPERRAKFAETIAARNAAKAS